jgi:hypothetical protein
MNYASIEAVDKATGATEWVFRNVPIRIPGTVEFLLYRAGKRFPSYAFDLCIYITETQKHFATG